MRSFSVLFKLLLENELANRMYHAAKLNIWFWKMSLMLAMNSRSSFSFQGLNTNCEGIKVKTEHKIRLVCQMIHERGRWRKLISWWTLRCIFRFLHVGNWRRVCMLLLFAWSVSYRMLWFSPAHGCACIRDLWRIYWQKCGFHLLRRKQQWNPQCHFHLPIQVWPSYTLKLITEVKHWMKCEIVE